jgi:hypothetical protein
MDHLLAQEPLAKETPVEHRPLTVVLVVAAVAQAVPVVQPAEQLVVPQETVYPTASQAQQPFMPLVVPALAPVLEVLPEHQAVSLQSPMQQLVQVPVVAVAQVTVRITRQGSAAVESSL